MPKGQIIKVLAGFYYVDTGKKVVSCRARGKFRNRGQKPLVGDFCSFQEEKDGSGYILTLEKRHNQLERPPICNVDQALLVFSIAQPDFDQMLLDQFLAMVEYEKIKPIIIITKIDLNRELIPVIKKKYNAYDLYFVSSKENEGIEEIKPILKNRVTVVTGQSGVGKSSLLNALNIELNIETNEISQALGRGKHTTRHVELIPMYGGYIADTPGFSSLELKMDPVELAVTNHDFRELSHHCKFRGCLHDSEPHCAVKEAVEAGEIDETRYVDYLQLLKQVKERKDKRYG